MPDTTLPSENGAMISHHFNVLLRKALRASLSDHCSCLMSDVRLSLAANPHDAVEPHQPD